jgi:2-polyprenyl-6-hydroxyphenyl methylase/3-demethylubiquinone-9 3-methyltransferase
MSEFTTAPLDSDARFAFGRNWTAFLASVDEQRIEKSCAALRDLLGTDSLPGKRFIDVGCGSGLSSLAALRLGAEVFAFDYDRQRRREPCAEAEVRAGRSSLADRAGSVLDTDYLAKLGQADVVLLGVLHHTGSMWDAMNNVARLVAPEAARARAVQRPGL